MRLCSISVREQKMKQHQSKFYSFFFFWEIELMDNSYMQESSKLKPALLLERVQLKPSVSLQLNLILSKQTKVSLAIKVSVKFQIHSTSLQWRVRLYAVVLFHSHVELDFCYSHFESSTTEFQVNENIDATKKVLNYNKQWTAWANIIS